MIRRSVAALAALGVSIAITLAAQDRPQAPSVAQTKIVLLGTGMPAPTPDRSGPATAIVVNDTAYLVDFSFGYRFDTPDRSIVLSGDTNPTQATIDACRGCDVLIHEVHTLAWLAVRPEAGGAPPGTFRRFSEQFHTTTAQLAALAREAKPKLLILYHYNALSPEELQSDMMSRYDGHFVIGRDLDVY